MTLPIWLFALLLIGAAGGAAFIVLMVMAGSVRAMEDEISSHSEADDDWDSHVRSATAISAPVTDPLELGLRGVHDSSVCEGRPCPMHAPTDHHMRSWPVIWRSDRRILERICGCLVGHPDPDQFEHWDETGRSSDAVHGCCLCCSTKEAARQSSSESGDIEASPCDAVPGGAGGGGTGGGAASPTPPVGRMTFGDGVSSEVHPCLCGRCRDEVGACE